MLFGYLGLGLGFMGFVHFECFSWFVHLFPHKIEGVKGKKCEKFFFVCFCSAQLDSTKLMCKIQD